MQAFAEQKWAAAVSADSRGAAAQASGLNVIGAPSVHLPLKDVSAPCTSCMPHNLVRLMSYHHVSSRSSCQIRAAHTGRWAPFGICRFMPGMGMLDLVGRYSYSSSS